MIEAQPIVSMSKNVLITGGSGLIGTRLTELLMQQGYQVAHLSRQKENKQSSLSPQVKIYFWDIASGQLDAQALLQADHIVHLAGTSVADQRWTSARKREILESRTQSTQLIANQLRKVRHHVQSFVSASAIGYYGADTGDRIITEDSPSGSDFLAEVTRRWEAATDAIADLSIRTVKLRIGIVLSEKGGALAKMVQPIRMGAGAPLGSGKQVLSWIHLDDVARLFIYALENEQMQGAYNAVGPQPVSNEELTRQAARVLDKPLWLPRVPAFGLRLALGEMAEVVLGGNRVLNQRIAQETTFRYQFPQLKPALENLLK
jgi:uncharacterized protein